jgi:hypothetical protein
MVGLKEFTMRWLRKNMVPLTITQVSTLDEWLLHAPYSEARKLELKKLYDYCLQNGFLFFDKKGRPVKAAYCKCFLKDEGYPSFKFARGIFSRTDFFKVFCAPWFKSIEKQLFTRKEFIKKIPVSVRSDYIDANFIYNTSVLDEVAVHTLNTDYSSFECSFSRELIEACEEQLYYYMLQDIPDCNFVLDTVMKVLKGINVLKFRNVTAKVVARRMSGEMNTSLGNGFANLMIYLYLIEIHQCDNLFVLVEGDDLLAQYKGPLFTLSDYEQFGLIVKTVYCKGPNEASFCGQLYDAESKIVIADPIKVILNFGWTDINMIGCKQKKILEQLRAKSLSYAFQYHQCPIIYPLAQTFIRLTFQYKVGKLRDKHRQQMLEKFMKFNNKLDLTLREIPLSAREFMQNRFGISIADQLEFENYLDGLKEILPLSHNSIERYIPQVMRDFDDHYVRLVDQVCALRCDLQF